MQTGVSRFSDMRFRLMRQVIFFSWPRKPFTSTHFYQSTVPNSSQIYITDLDLPKHLNGPETSILMLVLKLSEIWPLRLLYPLPQMSHNVKHLSDTHYRPSGNVLRKIKIQERQMHPYWRSKWYQPMSWKSGSQGVTVVRTFVAFVVDIDSLNCSSRRRRRGRSEQHPWISRQY